MMERTSKLSSRTSIVLHQQHPPLRPHQYGNSSNRTMAPHNASSCLSKTRAPSSLCERYSNGCVTTSTSSSPSAVIKKVKLTKRNLQELPQEIVLQILEWLDDMSPCPHNSSMIAISETNLTMNQFCHIYMLRRWNVSSSTTVEHADSETIHKDGILQRLQVEDATFAQQLYQQYIHQGEDENDDIHNNTNNTTTSHQRNDRHRNIMSTSYKGVMILYDTTIQMIQIWIQRIQQSQQVILRGIHTTCSHVQKQCLPWWHSHSRECVTVVLVLMLALWLAFISRIKDECSVGVGDRNETSTIVPSFGIATIVSILMLISSTIRSRAQPTQNRRQGTRNGREGIAGNEQTVSFTSKSWLGVGKRLRRTYSQPDFVSFATLETIHASITTANNTHNMTTGTTPNQRKTLPLKRCQTVASTSLASFGENHEDHTDHISLNTFNHEERSLLSGGNVPVVGVASCDIEDDDFGSFVILDDEDDEVEVRVMDHNTGALESSSSHITPSLQSSCINNTAKNASAIQPSQGVQAPAIRSRTKPRGWVGLYHHANQLAKKRIVNMVKEARMRAYKKLNMNDRNDLSTSLMNACIFNSENAVSIVRLLSKSIPTQDFYIGADGTESCALHTAAFHGSSQVIDFLCRDIDMEYVYCNRVPSSTVLSVPFTYNDGGLCDVNETDVNGWTALHYAVGANNVDAVRVLIQYGAKLNVHAANGYTPLQWAIRLQHHVVADELQSAMTINQQEQQRHSYWYKLYEKVHHAIFTILILTVLIIPSFGPALDGADST